MKNEPKLKPGLFRSSELSYKRSHKYIIGADEAGRGPLAGPVVCAAAFIKDAVEIDGIMDSKATTESSREAIYETLIKNPNVIWSATIVSHKEIDEINILQASLEGMKRSVQAVLNQCKPKIKDEYLALVDGNKIPSEMPIACNCVVKGDSSVFSIAAASIIAKVTRDRIMAELHLTYPIYNFAKHKGYPTFEHRSILHEHGPCPVHRLTYAPVKAAAIKHGLIIPEPTAESDGPNKDEIANSSKVNTKKRKVQSTPSNMAKSTPKANKAVKATKPNLKVSPAAALTTTADKKKRGQSIEREKSRKVIPVVANNGVRRSARLQK